jgi:hypothetical protein
LVTMTTMQRMHMNDESTTEHEDSIHNNHLVLQLLAFRILSIRWEH